MGIFCSCCPEGGNYEPIPDLDRETSLDPGNPVSLKDVSGSGTDPTDDGKVGKTVDPAEEGRQVDQKFVSKSRYESKFVWISVKKKTIHLSDHESKERRHKEASLAEVTSIVAGPPAKYKPPVGTKNNQAEPLNSKHCLTIHFEKGGGIDLKFTSEPDRDHWYSLLNSILLTQIESSNQPTKLKLGNK